MRFRPSGQLARSLFAAAALWAAFLVPPTSWSPEPARATVPTTSNTVTVAGNGSQTVFSFPFVGVAPSDIVVLFTDASGNQTTLTQGPGPTQYQVTLNAAVPPALWGVGGTITYNPSGTPIASGTTLTISRVLPVQQNTSLQNQASFGQYAQTAEQAIDLQNMQLQQVAGAIGRALQANPANSAAPLPLPPAAQVAGQGLCFDGTGNNVIGCVLPSSGVISSAMAPVVGAASIAAGRAALGVGTLGQENLGGACGGGTLQDDGTGNARVAFATVADATNQSVTCAFHGTQRAATGALVYMLPRANTLFNGFGFWVYPLNQAVTLAPNAADNFPGLAGGASLAIPAGSSAFVTTNAAASGAWYVTLTDPLTPRTPSNNAPLNLTFVCTAASNALTCAVKDRNGNDPSPASPAVYTLVNTSGIAAQEFPRVITAPLSITIPNTATLGTVNGQANRIWLAIFDNFGTPVLAVYNSLNAAGPSIKAWDETALTASTPIAGGANSPQTWYAASSIPAVNFKVIGYVESTQPTAGTWSVAPTKAQLFGPGVKKPGDPVNEVSAFDSGAPNTTSGTYVALTGKTVVITVQSAANVIRVEASGKISNTAGETGLIRLSRGTTAATNMFGSESEVGVFGCGGCNSFSAGHAVGYDVPNTTGNVTYAVQGFVVGGQLTFGSSTEMIAREIQI
jgi:hypothetical protein